MKLDSFDLISISQAFQVALQTNTPFFMVGEGKGKTAMLSERALDAATDGYSMVYFQGQSIPDNGYIEHLITKVNGSNNLFLVIDNAENLSENQWETLLSAENVRLIVIGSSAPEAVKDIELYCPCPLDIGEVI